MNNNKLIHEAKIHGQNKFSFSIYHSLVPCCLTSFPLHWHDEIEITYIKKGCADFYICNQLYTAHEGDILISNTKYPHSMQQYKDESADYFSILINTKLLQQDMKSEVIHDELIDKIRRIEDTSLIFPPFIKADSELAKILCPFLDNIIKHRKECYSEYQLLVLGNILIVFNYLLKNTCSTDKNICEFRYDFSKIKPAVHAVHNQYEQKLLIQQVASMCNLSKSHFMKLFKNITGKGFNEFLIEHRLHMASLMLKNTDDKLIDVSVNCGFENQSYFTRCFTKHFKMTPSQFRRKNLNQH